jgi:hypothetical protein
MRSGDTRRIEEDDKRKSKRRSAAILLVMASVLFLVAAWDLPDPWPGDNLQSPRHSGDSY